jgi:hypothetical protein
MRILLLLHRGSQLVDKFEAGTSGADFDSVFIFLSLVLSFMTADLFSYAKSLGRGVGHLQSYRKSTE